MINGKRLQHRFAPPVHVVRRKKSIALQDIGNQVTVGQHGTFSDTGCPAGVLEHCQIGLFEDHCSIGRFGPALQHIVKF